MSRLTTKIDENDYCFSCSRNNFYYGNGSKEITNKLGQIEDILEEYDIEDLTELKIALDYFEHRYDKVETRRMDNKDE